MTTLQLQYLLEVYRTGSMSKASANLFVAQPNLSNSIRALEQELGFLIFTRTNHGVIPTKKGLLVIEQARRMWDSYQEILQVHTSPESRRLRIGGLSFEPACRAYERLCLQYQEEDSMDFSYVLDARTDFDSLILSDYDLQLALLLPDNVTSFSDMAASKGFRITALREVPVVLRCGPNHPLYEKQDVTPQDFAVYPFADYAYRVYLDYPNLSHILPIDRKRTATVNDRIVKHHLVAQGKFISMGCQLPADTNEKYSFRNIPLPGVCYTLVLVERARQHRPPLAQQYVQLLEEELLKI